MPNFKAFWLDSEGTQMALRVWRKRKGAGRLREPERTLEAEHVNHTFRGRQEVVHLAGEAFGSRPMRSDLISTSGSGLPSITAAASNCPHDKTAQWRLFIRSVSCKRNLLREWLQARISGGIVA